MSDSIEQIIAYMEDGTVEEGSSCADLFVAIDKLRAYPDKYLNTYRYFKMFTRPSLSSSNFIPNTEGDEDREITITIGDENNRNSSIS